MKYLVKKMLYILLAGVLIFLLGAILWLDNSIAQTVNHDRGTEQTFRYHFAMVVDSTDSSYWDMVYQGAQEAAAQKDAYVEQMEEQMRASYDLEDELRMSFAAKVDGIFLVPDGSEEIGELLEKNTQEANPIPVLTVMEQDSGSARAGYVGINAYEQGRSYGTLVGTLWEEKGVSSVTLLSPAGKKRRQSSGSDLNGIYSGFMEVLSENGLNQEIEVNVAAVNDASIFNCKRDIRSLLNAEKAPDVLICPDDLFTSSACQVVVEQNLVGKVALLGGYVDADVLDYIQKGTLYASVAVDPYALGRICVEHLLEANEEGRTSDYTVLEMLIIDQSNAKELRSQYGRSAE